MPNRDWSAHEAELLVADYFEMLSTELRGKEYSKTAHRQELARLLNGRSDGSIERKHQNVSAILIELGHPFIDGYKPLGNYQGLLYEIVVSHLQRDNMLRGILQESVEAPAPVPSIDDLLDRWEAPPAPIDDGLPGQLRERLVRPKTVVNWLQIETQNHWLGRSGEQFALAYERARLRALDKPSLADRVEHVALSVGDGLGYDIRSFEVNGRDRFIEVKTTAYSKQVPFFLSRHELEVSRRLADSYHLYRLFRFRKDPRLYGLSGALDLCCDLDPVQYSARVRRME
jgi:hypothetical protein